MFERTPSSRPAAGQPAFDPAAARMRGDQALARALVLRRALDELDRQRLAARSSALATPPSQTPAAGLPLQGAVGLGRENRPEDLKIARRRLAALGYAPALQTWQELPFFDPLLETGLRAFQAGRGLRADGWMRPGGETERALAAELAGRWQPAATPASALTPTHPLSTLPRDAAKPQLPPRYLTGGLTDPLLHRPADPFAIDRDSLGRPFPSRPGAATAPRPRDPRVPEGPQIAFGPALALPFFLGASASGINWAALATILGVSATAGLLAGDTMLDPASGSARHPGRSTNGGSQRRQTSPLGPTPPFEPDRPPEDDGIEGYPAEERRSTILINPAIDPDTLPDIEGFRPDDLPDLIEFFPDHGGLFADTNIVESRGKAWTQDYNDLRKNHVRAEADMVNPDAKHIKGARDNDGNKVEELWMRGRITGGKTGSSRSDFTFKDKTTDRQIHFNTIDTLADGITETKREYGGGIRIIINMEAGDFYVQIPKVPEGKVEDEANFRKAVSPLLKAIHKPWTPADALSIESLEDLFHWYNPTKSYGTE